MYHLKVHQNFFCIEKYDYGNDQYDPYTVERGNASSGRVECPVRLFLNGVDITAGCLERITHTAVRTTGHNTRYGSDYQSGAGVGASATISYTGLPADGNTITLVSADNTSKTYEFDNNRSVTGTNTKTGKPINLN